MLAKVRILDNSIFYVFKEKLMKLLPFLFSLFIGAHPVAMEELEINPLTPTPFNDNLKVTIESADGGSVEIQLRSFPIGSNTYSEALEIERVRSNPDGNTVLVLINGKNRANLTALSCNPLMEEFRYFNRDCSLSLTYQLVENIPDIFVVHAIAINSYNESIKMKRAMDMRTLRSGMFCEPDTALQKALHEPYILYNQPQGVFDRGENILLDFYLVNGELSENGNKVELYIDDKKVASLVSWVPYEIVNLPPGNHNIKLILISPSSKPYPSPFPPQEATIYVR